MKIIAIAGTGSGCGKTTLACGILRAFPGLGAVKISPRAGASRVEWGAGEKGKDTALYAGCGAAPVAWVVGPREAVAGAWDTIKGRFGGCRGVVIEGAGSFSIPEERFGVFVNCQGAGGNGVVKNSALVGESDVIVDRTSLSGVDGLLEKIALFLASPAQP